eukprot:2232735-Amphidinium_carterae.1
MASTLRWDRLGFYLTQQPAFKNPNANCVRSEDGDNDKHLQILLPKFALEAEIITKLILQN